MGVLVTGAAGFVGMHVAEALLARGEMVVGVDNLNAYYDPALKRARLARLEDREGFRFVEADIADALAMERLAAEVGENVAGVVHLAAQAGVRYSLEKPFEYVRSNLEGHMVVLELCRHRLPALRHLVYASSSSVYGGNDKVPFAVGDRVDHPVSLYAATKRADELLSHAYAHLHGLPQSGLRFFTVYGPWGRPDMAYFSFANAIMAGEPITLYDGGRLRRDFTYIDDIVAGVVGCLDRPPAGAMPLRLLNIGNHGSETVTKLVQLLERELARPAIVREAPRPAADVEETFASVESIAALTGFTPKTTLEEGIPRFAAWFKAWRASSKES